VLDVVYYVINRYNLQPYILCVVTYVLDVVYYVINRYNLQPYILCVVTYVLDVVYYVPVMTLHLHC